MKINHKLAIASAVASLVLGITTAPAMAGADYGRHSRFMAYFDSNKDNMVTIDELNEASKDRFAKMDANGNNVVTAEEFKAYISDRKQNWRNQRFSSMDTNSDKQISKEEYVDYKAREAEQRFQRLDANNDQVLTDEEYGQKSKRRHFHRCDSGKHHHREGGVFNRLDANHDGQLTLEESLAAWGNWFKRIDANNDQVVTLEEVQNFRQHMRDKRKN